MEAATIRRLVAFVIGLVAVALNKKLGLQLDPTAEASIVALIIGYIGQSAYKEAQEKKAAAVVVAADKEKAAIVDAQSAIDSLNKTVGK